MPTELQIKAWACSICKKQYDAEQEACNCEQRHKTNETNKRWTKWFPTRHRNDSRWSYHCVDCGMQLLEYEYLPDPAGRAEVGQQIYRSSFVAQENIFGGMRCATCCVNVKTRILDAMEKNGSRV